MAVPVVTPNLNTITDCEAITGWSGDTFLLEPNDFKQGANSVVTSMTVKGGANQAIFTPAAAIDMTGQHFRGWYKTGLGPYLLTTALRGIEFWISDGTRTHYWTLGGFDSVPEGWQNLVIYVESTPTNGYDAAFDFTNVTSMGWNFNTDTASKPRGVDNFWVDYLRYGDGLTITGGTSGDEINLDEVATVDAANGYGIVVKSEETGVLTLLGDINIGDGATTTFYKEDKSVAIFADANVSSTLYKYVGQGVGCDIDLSGFTLKAYLQNFLLDMDEANLAALAVDGCSISNASAVLLKPGQSVLNTVFDSCGQIIPDTAIFQNNTISNYAGALGALLWPDSQNTKNNTFLTNSIAIEIDTQSSPKLFDNMVISGSTTADVNNTSGAAVTVNLNNGALASTSTGSGVTFVNSKTLTIVGVPTGAEYRLYVDSGVQGELGTTELQGAESWTGGDISYPYSYTVDTDVILQVMHTGYEEYLFYGTLVNGNGSVTVVLTPEENV
jgi:hypothetical protein